MKTSFIGWKQQKKTKRRRKTRNCVRKTVFTFTLTFNNQQINKTFIYFVYKFSDRTIYSRGLIASFITESYNKKKQKPFHFESCLIALHNFIIF